MYVTCRGNHNIDRTSSKEIHRSSPSIPAWQNCSEQAFAMSPRLLSVTDSRLKGDESHEVS